MLIILNFAFLNLGSVVSLYGVNFYDLPKIGGYMNQRYIFSPDSLSPTARYHMLFENLPEIDEKRYRKGRSPISRNAILKSLIYRNLRGITTLVGLEFELHNNPSMADVLGFNPFKQTPSDERFSEFLRSTPNTQLQKIRRALVGELICDGAISGKTIALDSCPIVIPVKENNLKTSIKNRYDKEKCPRGDNEARLGVMIYFPKPYKKEVHYFWGYRNHVLNDTASELPIVEQTLQANKSETSQAIPMLKGLCHEFQLPVKHVLGDANYDSESTLKFIFEDMKAKAFIPMNPRNTQNESYVIRGNKVYCQANLPMRRKGKMKSKGIVYCQYICPLHWSKKFQGKYLFCPAGHPKYSKQKGCNALLRLTPGIREKIPYGTQEFKSIYNQRTSVERVFSRLLSITMQNPTVKGLQAISNHCTIAHITVLLVALTARRTGHEDKICFVKSFVPNFLAKWRNISGKYEISQK